MRFALVLLLFTANACAQAPAVESRQPDVIYVPTPQEVVEEMLKLAKVGKNDVLYDLGSGDGRIPVTAAKRFGIRATGIDIDPQRIASAPPASTSTRSASPRPTRTRRRTASRTSCSSSAKTCSRPSSATPRW
jgi:hypothetical protein